jgi:hypothetical protein
MPRAADSTWRLIHITRQVFLPDIRRDIALGATPPEKTTKTPAQESAFIEFKQNCQGSFAIDRYAEKNYSQFLTCNVLFTEATN